MVYKVEFLKSAEKDLHKLPKEEIVRIYYKLNELANNNSQVLDIKKLEGEEDRYRLRSGNYRVVYKKFNDILLILVIEIGHRKNIYK